MTRDIQPLLPFIVAFLAFAVIGGVVGAIRGRAGAGICLSLILGPLGWLLVLGLSDLSCVCPACRKPVDPKATLCPFCRSPQPTTRNLTGPTTARAIAVLVFGGLLAFVGFGVYQMLPKRPTPPTEAQLRAAEAAKVKAAAETRERLHLAARDSVLAVMKPANQVRHSTLLSDDDDFTACRELGNSVWESRGVIEGVPTTGNRPVREPWRVLFSVGTRGDFHELFLQFGKFTQGDEQAALAKAGVATQQPR